MTARNGGILYGSFQPIWLKDDDNENRKKLGQPTAVFLRQGKESVVTFQFEGEQFATRQ